MTEFLCSEWDNEFPDTLDPTFVETVKYVFTLCEKFDCYIAGGAARALVTGAPTSDIDIYCLTESRMNDVHYALGAKYPLEYKRNVATFNVNGVELQLIEFKDGSPNSILESYDFTCCQVATNGQWVVNTVAFEEDEPKKLLRWTEKATYEPANLINRMWRIQKYFLKGYKFAEGQADIYFKMEWDEASKYDRNEAVRTMSSRIDSGFRTQPVPTPVAAARPRSRGSRFNTVRDLNEAALEDAFGFVSPANAVQETVAQGYSTASAGVPVTVVAGGINDYAYNPFDSNTSMIALDERNLVAQEYLRRNNMIAARGSIIAMRQDEHDQILREIYPAVMPI